MKNWLAWILLVIGVVISIGFILDVIAMFQHSEIIDRLPRRTPISPHLFDEETGSCGVPFHLLEQEKEICERFWGR